MSSSDPLIGQEIGEYRVQSILGRGGMGVVYKAEDTALGISVALKMIDPALAKDASFVRRFRAEARAMARIASPNIVRVMAMRQTDHGLFIVMEYVDGGTLHDRMQNGPMPWKEVWPIVSQTLEALEKAHSVGVVHRDIKPRNIMLTGDGVVKVTDFGLAKMVSDDPSITVTQAIAGTLLYMSPEQVKASANVDARSDLFALGLMTYEMLAGRLPFDRDAGEFAVMRAIVEQQFPPPTKHEPSIPPPVARGVMKALEKEPDRRYRSATEMREALTVVAPSAAGAKASDRSTRTLPRVAVMAATGVAAVLVLAALILWVVLPSEDPDVHTDLTASSTTTSSQIESLDPFAEPALDLDEAASSNNEEAATPTAADRPTTPVETAPARPTPAPGTLEASPQAGVIYTVAGSRLDGSRSLSPGNHTVRCEAGGHSAQTSVRVQSGQTTQVTCHVQQQVNISAAFEDGPASWVAVIVNGENTGQTTPARLTLGPGQHSISVQRDGHEVLTAAQVVTVQPSFSPLEPVRLSFRVRPTS